MADITLSYSTHDPQIDTILQGVISVFETAFPGRIQGYYVVGSYSDGSAVPASDLDLVVVFKGDFVGAEESQAKQVSDSCTSASPIHLDVAVRSEDMLRYRGGYGGGFKLASLCVYGEDIRDQLPLPPLDSYTRNVMNGALRVLQSIRDTTSLAFPVSYPNADDEFFGYICPVILRDGTKHNGTRQLVGNLCLAASAMLAFKAGRIVGRKSDAVRLYSEHFHDEWAGYLANVYQTCRGKWGYLVPESAGEQERLRAFCKQALAFENHFLQIHHDYCVASENTSLD